ncbi:benenodin family lasso peptide [Oleiagrimonas sp. C23AA]|nr:benenodin family lasso peptide [Oleiagrimonas sp. C23AA]NII11301.1 benenodin family lasso peptide [Oleiagrimonas sp. C23AA]
MNTNDDIHTNASEDVIELGVASVETKGLSGITENFGAVPMEGISDA